MSEVGSQVKSDGDLMSDVGAEIEGLLVPVLTSLV